MPFLDRVCIGWVLCGGGGGGVKLTEGELVEESGLIVVGANAGKGVEVEEVREAGNGVGDTGRVKGGVGVGADAGAGDTGAGAGD